MADIDEDEGILKKVKNKLTPSRQTFAKMSYLFLLAIGFVMAILLRDNFFNIIYKIEYCPPDVSHWFFKYNGSCVHPYQDYIEPWFNTFGVTLTGFSSVHRVTFSMALYFLVHFLLSLIGCMPNSTVKFSRFGLFLNENPCVHAIKYIFFLLFVGLMFFIHDTVFVIIAYISLIVSAIFLLIQVVLLVEMAWGWQDHFNKMADEDDSSYDDDEGFQCDKGCAFYLGTAGVLYVCLFFFLVFMFICFSWKGCWFMIVPMVISTILCLILLIWSCIPAVSSGILPPAIGAIYASYMCYSALLSYPDKTCNVFSAISSSIKNVNGTNVKVGGVNLNNFGQIFSIVYTVILAILTTVYTASTTGGSGTLRNAFCLKRQSDKDRMMELKDDDDAIEREQAISYVEFHLVFGTILTNWEIKEVSSDLNGSYNINVSYTAFAIKLVMELIALVLMAWVAIKTKFIDPQLDDDDDF